ncbi:hypothetical protein Bhyg_08090, partial [Pseudolycoriella hygida]
MQELQLEQWLEIQENYLQTINYIKPIETYQKYIEFTNKILGGRIGIDEIMNYLRTEYDPLLLANEFVKTFDRNNDGWISKEEFETGMETIKAHDPRVRNVSYEDFVIEADANK